MVSKDRNGGQRNGPPYPLGEGDKSVAERKADGNITNIVKEAIRSGKVSTKINREMQLRHSQIGHQEGKSYLHGDLEFAQQLVDELSGTGQAKKDRNGNWVNKEAVIASKVIGTHVDVNGVVSETDSAMIVYSKTGTHIYPRKGQGK